ncbi:amino acid-binding ACT domain protein [Caldicellulosiruptor saccharolyticus DSM 8903]|uniref:Amino acid-binding ACT domain protein n=1 Tax=Caldicellulosiruptor saccharolyticus (strain ATCC 43494 / DSM 8903 / Tp8T 6331) TaxID=351627 RepID=A4XL50_CALS8|nr:ACT domain-containing protein [Caldicellulosiruptor saccharolyticus]ABP67635.1 amino acid-binding ACT domain protein [Caldicellulosiruptor saccharolyticus DSM 8903]
MYVKQISVFLENKSGRLAEVTSILGKNNIDISALSIADTTDFGILRLIVNKPDLALQVLKENGFTVSATDVIAIAVEDKPGGLAKVLDILYKNDIGIEYMYAFVGKITDEALVILKVENSEEAINVLKENNVRILSANEVYSL